MSACAPTPDHRVRDFWAPLDGAQSGRLVFAAGTPELALSADPELPDLLRARFSRILPDVHTSRGEVVVTYPPVVPVLGWIRYGVLQPHGRVTLNPSVPWELEFRRGITRLEADLRDVDVREVVIRSGASHAALRLGRPHGTVRISMTGGVSDLEVERPAGTPVRVSIDGSIGSMTFDDDVLGAIGGRLQRATEGWQQAADRYDVTVAGGIGHLVVVDLRG